METEYFAFTKVEVHCWKVPYVHKQQFYLQRTALMCLFAYDLHFCPHTCQSAPAMSKSGSPHGNLGQRKRKNARWSKVDETLMYLFLRQYFFKKAYCVAKCDQFRCFNKYSFSSLSNFFPHTFWELLLI